MKHLIFLTAFLLTGNLFFAQPQHTETSAETYVLICTGRNSKRYHNNAQCKGLTNCRAEIHKVTLSKAVEMGRTPCKLCYPD